MLGHPLELALLKKKGKEGKGKKKRKRTGKREKEEIIFPDNIPRPEELSQ